MYSILSLVVCILCSVFFLNSFGIQFLSFIYLVVYIGAIAILFLFVVMMLNINCINSLNTSFSFLDTFIYLLIFSKGWYIVNLVSKQLLWTSKDIFYKNTSIIIQCPDLTLSIKGQSYDFVGPLPILTRDLSKSNLNSWTWLNLQSDVGYYNTMNSVISGLNLSTELSNFCLLYNVYFLYLIVAGFVLLFAMLGSISLCIVK